MNRDAWRRAGLLALWTLGGGCAHEKPLTPASHDVPLARETAAQRSAEGWLSILDRGDYARGWAESATHLRSKIDVEAFRRSIAGARAPLGPEQARRVESAEYKSDPAGGPPGEFVEIVFGTTFEKTEKATETVTTMKEADGRWRVAGYHVEAECVGTTPPASILPPPPSALGLDPFYKKYIDAGGIPVVSSEHASDRALFAAREIVQHLLVRRPDIRNQIIRARVRVAVMSPTEQQLDIPEQSVLAGTPTDTPGVGWNERGRGLGGSFEMPVASCGEENLLCVPCDRYRGENVLIHEFGHTIQVVGLAANDAFQHDLHTAYEAAVAKGLWKGVYAGRNEREYWAEGVQDWFDANDGGGTNEVQTRAGLATYDPALYALLAGVFADDGWRYSCSEMAHADLAEFQAVSSSIPALSPVSMPAPSSCPRGMAALPGGSFLMGYGVTVKPFCMDLSEVTVAQYAACAHSRRCSPAATTTYWVGIADADRDRWSPACNGARSDRQDHPVNCVDWNQADAYCRAQGKRLPAEEEWEWAARGGSRGWTRPWGFAPPTTQLCWSGTQKRDGTCPVGAFPEGDAPGGIHDLAGNVWEFTSSRVGGADPIVAKGGSYHEVSASLVESSHRDSGEPAFRGPTVGFRCVK